MAVERKGLEFSEGETMTKRILATWILLSFATAASGDWVYVDACGMGCCPQMVWQNTPQPAALRFVPTPHSVVERALQIAAPTRSDVIYDLGCGDARVLIAACREYRCAGLGVEIDAETAAISVAPSCRPGFRSLPWEPLPTASPCMEV